MIIDAHCHIYDRKLKELEKEILSSTLKNGQICICSGDNLEDSKLCVDLANNNSNIYATVGFHPHEAKDFNEKSILELENIVKKNKKVVAIGEIGLDYYYNLSPKDTQIKVLKEQIILASKLGLPCVFHVRDAMGDFLQVIKEMKDYLKFGGYVHSYSGSVETANILLGYGFYLGFNGIITFENARKSLEILKEIPIDKILIETDCPYLTPVPFRGKPNRPEYVEYVANKIAEVKGLSKEVVVAKTTENAIKFFNIKVG